MLVITGLATVVVSILFAAVVLGFATPKPPTVYDKVQPYDEVQNFLVKCPNANITTQFYDCVQICEPRD